MLEDSSVFKLQALSPRSAEVEGENVVAQLSFEMNLDLLRINRDSYTVVDMLSDIGGIETILISGISVFLSIWNYKHFDFHLASQLYKIDGDGNDSYFKLPKFSNIILLFIKFLPKKAACCRLNQRQQALD